MRYLRFSPYLKYLQFIVLLAVILFNFSPVSTFPVYAISPANDAWQNATVIGSIPFADEVDTTDANQEIDEPELGPATEDLCDGVPLRVGLTTVWYKYIAPVSGLVYLDTLGSNQSVINPSTGTPYEYDTYIAVYTGTPSNNPTLVACNDDNAVGFRSQLGFNAASGATYYIQVAQYNGTLNTTYVAQPYQGGNLKFHATSFADVPGDYWAWRWIEGTYAAGITSGCTGSPRQYCSTGTVTRDQMAVFLLRAMHGSAYTPPAVGGSTGFNDVATNYWAAAWIKQLAAEGVTSGCGGGNYCPANAVTRDQMAVFLVVAMGLSPLP